MTTLKRLFLSIVLLAMIVLAGACTNMITPPSATPEMPTPEAPIPETNANGIIFTQAQTEASLDVVWPRPSGVWTPTAEDIAQLEADLPAFLRTAQNPWLRPDPPIWDREPDYMRQYLGIVENGNEIIYANFFCDPHDFDWRSAYYFVNDGGDCYFQVKYNPQTREFFDLSVNGEA
jgi:hypothetical protein